MSSTSLDYYLKSLRLPVFLDSYTKIGKACAKENLCYEGYLLRLSEQEYLARHTKRIQTRIKKANFPSLKTLDSFDFKALPNLSQQVVLNLSKGDYLERHENIISLGNSGTGKTHTAIALGLSACQQGKSVYFTQASQLVHMLLEAREERELLKLKKKLLGYDLLIIDELGFVPFSKSGAELLFDVFSGRYEKGSVIVTSNLPFSDWTEIFGCERLTGALLDRLTHHVNILEMNGDSYRLSASKKGKGRMKTKEGQK
jgi:DNA replication protein DnaC